ncbi:MAG: type II secretion system F family protein [Planctomycetota bacterium]|jgi:type IV pilus assembly protein PilC
MANPAKMYHKLSLLLSAGVPVLQSLRDAAKISKGKIRKALLATADSIAGGDNLVEAMSRHPDVFLPLDVFLIHAGSESGNLTDVLEFLSRWYDFYNRLRRTILSGMVLPVFLVHFAAVAGPAPGFILKQYDLAEYYLKAATILSIWYVPTLIILGILHLTPKTGLPRKLLDALALCIPILGQAVTNLALSRFCRVFAMLYKAGVPIIQGVEVASGVTGNAVITGMLIGGADSGRAGKSICAGFSKRLPTDLFSIWQVGEDSGNLDEAVGYLAGEFSQVAELLFAELAKWLPRLIYFAILVIMGIQIVKSWGAINSFQQFQ